MTRSLRPARRAAAVHLVSAFGLLVIIGLIPGNVYPRSPLALSLVSVASAIAGVWRGSKARRLEGSWRSLVIMCLLALILFPVSIAIAIGKWRAPQALDEIGSILLLSTPIFAAAEGTCLFLTEEPSALGKSDQD